jgi:RNA polymerase sigma-70 factor (ECF subfamily)
MKLAEITMEMVQKSLNGSTKATNEIFKCVLGMAKHQVSKTLTKENTHTKDDVAQEITTKIVMSLHKFNPDFKFSTWAYRVCKNHIVDHTRKRRLNAFSISAMTHNSDNETEYSFDIEDMNSMDQIKNMENKETIRFVHALFKSELFSKKQKMVLKLRFIDDMKYSEIVEKTGFSMECVKGLIFRVKETVKKETSLKLQAELLLNK